MNDLDLTKIKYYPDRFYICLDGFDIDNLTTFITDLDIGQQQSIFIHEYYHYLTNIATLPGIRQFALNFCDRFRATTILTYNAGLDAFPLNSNTHENCKMMIEYWKEAVSLLDEDDIDYNLIQKVENTQAKKFSISSVERSIKPMTVITDEGVVNGGRNHITIHTTDLLNVQHFNLTFGAIDEFLSSSIDEFLFENDLSDIDPSQLSKRPFYPYCFFEELLLYYDIRRPSAFEKILIAYFALNSANPPFAMIDLLEKLQNGGYDSFQVDPEKYLLDIFLEAPQYDQVLADIKKFADQCYEQGRIHISQAITYYYDKFYAAQKFKEDDFFFFIRPFFANGEDSLRMKQRFLLALSRIINLFTPPVILKDKQLFYIDKLTTFGEATALILATYEILESIKSNKIAKRSPYLKAKYIFPDRDPDCDTFEKFTPPPIHSVFRLALNEIGLYRIYLDELERRKYNTP